MIQQGLKILDPERFFFGDRVFARTSLQDDGTKSLAQILPTDHEMVQTILGHHYLDCRY